MLPVLRLLVGVLGGDSGEGAGAGVEERYLGLKEGQLGAKARCWGGEG